MPRSYSRTLHPLLVSGTVIDDRSFSCFHPALSRSRRSADPPQPYPLGAPLSNRLWAGDAFQECLVTPVQLGRDVDFQASEVRERLRQLVPQPRDLLGFVCATFAARPVVEVVRVVNEGVGVAGDVYLTLQVCRIHWFAKNVIAPFDSGFLDQVPDRVQKPLRRG